MPKTVVKSEGTVATLYRYLLEALMKLGSVGSFIRGTSRMVLEVKVMISHSKEPFKNPTPSFLEVVISNSGQ